MTQIKRGSPLQKGRFARRDIAAAAIGLALFAYLILTCRRGIAFSDEAFYFTVPQRLLQGDKLLVHEWGVQQLSFLFLVVPYRLYTALAHGTEGIILFSRLLFVAADLFMYTAAYLRLRRYGACGLIAAFLFAAVFPSPVMALNYYTVGVFSFFAVCLLLFAGKPEKSVPVLFFAGVLVAFGVLAEPLTVVGYGIFFVLTAVLILLKKTDGVLINPRSLCWITLGAFASFVAFMAQLALTGSLALLPETLQYLASSRGYSAADMVDLSKLFQVFSLFGYEFLIPALAGIGAAIWLRRQTGRLAAACGTKKQANANALRLRRLQTARGWIFVASCVLFAACYIHAAVLTFSGKAAYPFAFLLSHGVPPVVFSLLWYLLCEKPDRRLLYVWAVGFGYSVFADVSSDVLMGSGGQIALVSGVFSFAALWRELRSGAGAAAGQTKRFALWLRCSAALSTAVFFLWTAGILGFEGFGTVIETFFHNAPAASFTAEITRGPCKGLKTTERIRDIYNAYLEDMDAIRAQDETASVFVYGLCPMAYLYLDTDCPADTTFFVPELETARQKEYWTLFPEKKPQYVYVPYYDDFLLETSYALSVSALMQDYVGAANYEETAGRAGVIVRVSQ